MGNIPKIPQPWETFLSKLLHFIVLQHIVSAQLEQNVALSLSPPMSVCDSSSHTEKVLKGTVNTALISFSFPAWHIYNGKTSRCKIDLAKSQ